MKGLIAAFIFTLASSAAFAQSGRRVEPAATPVPQAAVESIAEYSESTPAPRRQRAFSPAARQEAVANSLKNKPGVRPSPTPSPARAPVTPAPASSDGDEVVKVETDLITIPVSVYDRNGLYISGLKQTDFKVFEDGKEQAITYFGSSDKPFTVVLLLDTSPSTMFQIGEIQDAAIAFINQLKPQDQVIVIEFDGNSHVLAEATNDRARLTKAIRKADFGYNTALYEAVDFSLKKRLNLIKGRKAIVLFTDGVDTFSSRATYDSTLDLAEESETLVFPIYYDTIEDNRRGVISSPWPDEQIVLRPSTPEEYALGKKYLEELAAYTGGRVFRPGATPGGLTAAFEGIAEELRRQYVIGYSADESGRVGQRKQIKVRVNRPNLIVRSRDSYIVGSNSAK